MFFWNTFSSETEGEAKYPLAGAGGWERAELPPVGNTVETWPLQSSDSSFPLKGRLHVGSVPSSPFPFVSEDPAFTRPPKQLCNLSWK